MITPSNKGNLRLAPQYCVHQASDQPSQISVQANYKWGLFFRLATGHFIVYSSIRSQVCGGRSGHPAPFAGVETLPIEISLLGLHEYGRLSLALTSELLPISFTFPADPGKQQHYFSSASLIKLAAGTLLVCLDLHPPPAPSPCLRLPAQFLLT